MSSNAYRLTAPWYSGVGCILVFHRICPGEKRSVIKSIRGEEVTPEYLEAVIEYFRQTNYRIVSLNEVYSILKREIKIPEKFVAFTFDDGYADNYELAYPIFKKHSAPFAVYVTTGFIDGTAIMWPYLLDDLLMNNNRIEFDLKDRKRFFKCATAEEKEKAFLEISNSIKQLSLNDYYCELSKIFKQKVGDMCARTRELAMGHKAIRELSKDELVTIGSHTIHHLKLNTLSFLQARQEIMGSKQALQSMINKKVDHFSFPFGGNMDIGKREINIVNACEFKTATTMTVANIMSGHKDYLCSLPRIHVNGNDEDVNLLDMYVSGFFPCVNNRFKRTVV